MKSTMKKPSAESLLSSEFDVTRKYSPDMQKCRSMGHLETNPISPNMRSHLEETPEFWVWFPIRWQR